MIELKQFATDHGLCHKKDESGGLMVPEKLGHIYQHAANSLGVMFSELPKYSNRILLARRRQLVRAGFTLHQVGDAESILLFEPTNATQASAVIRAVGAFRKRKQKAAQLLNLRKGPEKMPLQAAGNDAMTGDGSTSQPPSFDGSGSLIPLVQSRGNHSHEQASC